MKTKFSRFGRSTVSVILAVMMLLSTMLVGTVSTVNAASTLQPTTGVVADGYYRIFVTDNYKTNTTHKLYWWGSSKENPTNWESSKSMNKLDGHNENSRDVYWYDIPSDITAFIIRPSGSKQSVDLTVSDADLKFSNGAGYYISNESDNKYEYAYWDASGLLPQETKPDVADSVALTANPTSVKVGKSVTLTPTVSGANSDSLTYTYKKTSGGTATEVKNDDNSLTVTPSEAGTYKYTVTVSAEGFSDVTSSEVSFTVNDVIDYYLAGRIKQNGTSDWVSSKDDAYKFTESDTEGLYYYESKYTPKEWSAQAGGHNQYFFIIDSSSPSKWYGSKDNSSSNTPKILSSTNDKSNLKTISSTDDTKTLTYINNQENVSSVTFWLDTRDGNMQLYYTSATAYSVTFGSNNTLMGSVTAKSGSSNISSGDSVAENSSVTFTATANEGYRFDGWYSDPGCTTAIEGATGATYTIAVTDNTTVYAKFVAVDYTVTYPEDTDAFTITDKSATTAHVGNIITFKVSAKTGYEIKSVTADSATVTNENGTYTFTMPANNVAITVIASLVQYEITKNGSDELTYKVGDDTVTTATMGQQVTVSATKTGYTLTSISVADENGGAVEVDGLTFTMPARKVTVTPTFTANNHKIAYDGTVTGLESVDVKTSANFGDTVSVTVTAKSGYTVTGITVKETNGDGTVEVTTVADKYQFTMPDYDVTITPVIEVAEIDAPTVNFIGGAGESTANISANQPYPITAEATPAANSQIQSAKAQITSNNASDATLTQTETGYNFTSNVEDTFTIKYTVVAVSTLDSSKTSTVEKTITITTKFTETQKAYNTLKAYYETVKNPEQSDYSTDAYAALTAKLADVQALIDAGLPASSATDTEKYTTAKTELEKAVADKLISLYLTGRFRIYDKNGVEHKIGYNEEATDENFKFSYVDSGLYSLYTGCTVDKLNETITQDGTAPQYFFIYDTKNVYGISKTPNESTKSSPAFLISRSSVDDSARFEADGKKGIVTLWIDTNNASDPSEYKFYYTVEVSPKYALSGQIGGSWDTYDATYLVKDATDDPYVFTYVLDNSDSNSSKLFRLIDSSNNQYGPSSESTVDLSNYNSADKSCSLSAFSSSSAAYGHNLSIPAGKYKLYVDQSGTTPKVWVERIIDTKNVTFSVTGEGTGIVSINGTNVGDTSVQAVEIGSSYTITLTPSADSYVESFKVGDTEVASNTYTGTMPNEDVAVTVVFAKKTIHSVLVESNNGGVAEADITNAYSGQRVKVTVNADDNYVFDSISVKEKTSQGTVDCTKNEDGTYTFVMPDDDVNVYANFREKNTYTVTVVSANQQLGTVALDNSEDTLTKTVKEGDTVTIKATPIDPNSFDTWTLTGKYEFKGCTSNDAEATVVVNSDVKATASFTETAPYQVAYGLNGTLMRMNKTKYDGIYISTGTIVSSPKNDDNPDSHFTIYDTANNEYASISASGYYWLKDDKLSITMGKNDSWENAYVHGSDKGLINNACSSAKYVVYNANTKTITLTDNPDYGTKATLYVKKGTYSTSFTTGNTKDYAESSVAAGLTAMKTDPCNTYSVAFDTNVNVQTTLTDTYRKAGYYVGAYCVNGRNYTASAKDADQGIYQANITITEDLAENGVVEVTPVYYNRVIEQNGDYITFYVDADQAVSDWGNTIAVDAYCYVNGVQSNADHLFGTYPGQPMVRDGRYYVINVPRYRYYIGTDGSLVKDTNSPVSGVTLNNYNNESIHGGLVPIKRNMQTYDFSDFVALANKKDVKTIMFQSKFYNATGDAKRNTKVIYNYDTEISDPTNAVKSISNIANANVNPYEDFTDYYGRATDLIGNILDDNQKTDENNLYVISTGSYNSSKSTSGYSTKGQWVTIWNVYDHSGNLITYGTPADFLDENTNQYNAIANNENYKGKPVKISYEKGLSYDNGVTSRTDGRWYYSTLGQEFTSDVAIEYKCQGQETYTADTDSNAGNNTGFVGTTTKATATINNVTTASFSSVTETAHLNVKVSNGWRFDGWFIKQGDKYTKVSDNYTDISTDVLMSNSYHIVACISEIPSGTLELNHMAYTGTDPASHSGTGFYYISAVLYDQTGAVKHSYTETQGKISIDDFAATDSLEITLRAVAHGDNTIYAVYEGIDAGYFEIGEEDYKGDSSFSYTFKVSANSLFKDDILAVNALNYYTDIVKVGGTCDITYKYYDRFSVEGEGNMVSYVVRNVELSTEEIQDNYQPSDSTITKYAPRIDTMYVDTKWKLDGATNMVDKGKSQATVIATQTNKTCKVYHPELGAGGYYNTDIKDGTPYTVEFNSLLKDENGNFLLTTPEYNANKTLKFAYWEVYKVDKNGQSEGEVVTKCYERNFGLRIMADYYIVPVYSENVPNLTANINSPVLNREIYGDSANPTDKLYVDLLTAFTSSDIPTFKENTTNLSVECGVFVVRNNTSTLSVEDRNTLVNAAISNSTDTTSEILQGYIRNDAVEESLVTQLNNLAKDSNVKDKTNTVANFGNDEYRITKLVFDNNSLTNKNRIDEVLKFTNNTANQNYIFTAYAFVVIKDYNGEVKDMCISESQYFNLCYVGNKALDNN